ncbi:Signal transduction histidine kinase [Vulgatibacter incomptus]|uniref:histidine kinase n=1 Tax=Vulgatibacter incomptus TaxID=1391653 RepID=A0A0K1P8R9_9BACT|nr:Signal transduction histidine kinase [Vulgatibacter incomptus]
MTTPLFDDLQDILAEERSPDALKKGLAALAGAFRPRSSFAVVHDVAFDRLNVALARGRSDPRVKACSPGEGAIGRSFADKAQVVEKDGALVAVPMVARGEAVGVLAMVGGIFAQPTGPSADELALVQAIANACGAALDMGRTRAELERRTRELETANTRLSEGDRTRDALLSHISHELRTPLTTIKGYLAMGLKGRLGELSEKQLSVIGICDRNADRLLRLINDLLLTARLEAGQMTLDPKALGLRSVLQEAVQFLAGDAETARVELSVEAPEGEVFIRGNRDRLVEGFMHLLERGLRGRRDGEHITLTLLPSGRSASVQLLLSGIQLPPPSSLGSSRRSAPTAAPPASGSRSRGGSSSSTAATCGRSRIRRVCASPCSSRSSPAPSPPARWRGRRARARSSWSRTTTTAATASWSTSRPRASR